ncbi:hypothetical protein [Snuella sedimenti]|uniref:NIPSNAP domain-containing protein n=1 Tax=Snuella sedimenti TaxID=2798802 RepID=A0A8J7IFN5_9FLAO|nr:hypothetical protein [Snuella sedimenti]MBJ6368087.1 hypothetical protein [Snuella sedimenti]
MIKKLISATIMVSLMFGAIVTVTAQDNSEDYKMWETVMLTPDNSKLKVLGEHMRKHNTAFHKEGAYKATVYNISTGPNAGSIIWEMGPMKFSHNDSRPGKGTHDDDWRDNVMPYIKKVHTIEYWKQDDELSNTSMLDGDSAKYPILFVRYSEIAKGVSISSVKAFYKQISETVKAMEGINPWGVYYNEFRQGDLGRHIATVGFFKEWAEFDEDNDFKETFLKVHGEGTWDAFLDLSDQVLTNSWDEIWVYNAYLSGR